MSSITNEIKIIKNTTSKINEVDFENLTFGNTFTDHMLICDF
jgi:branched-chain amino acid aminotransferase